MPTAGLRRFYAGFFAAFVFFLAISSQAAMARVDGVPATVRECMLLLRKAGCKLRESSDPGYKLKTMRLTGQLMARQCKRKRFRNAYISYLAITDITDRGAGDDKCGRMLRDVHREQMRELGYTRRDLKRRRKAGRRMLRVYNRRYKKHFGRLDPSELTRSDWDRFLADW